MKFNAVENVCTFLLLIVLYVLFVEPRVERWLHRRRRRQMEQDRRTWRLYATGGGHIEIHETRVKALELCQEKFGTVIFTDDEHGFIFYKPHGYVPKAPDSFC